MPLPAKLYSGSVSEAVDQLVAEARAGRLGRAEQARSVVGTIDLGDDPLLANADAAIRTVFTGSLARSLAVHEGRTPQTSKIGSRKKTRG